MYYLLLERKPARLVERREYAMTHYPRTLGLSLVAFVLFGGVGTAVAADPTTVSEKITDSQVKAALLEFEKLTLQEMQETGVPGLAVAVVYKDQPVYLKGFGVRETGKSDSVDADTVFQLASLSKPLGSTVIAGLVGDGIVRWDDTVIQHDPGFAMDQPFVTRNLTLRDLYSHRSGLPDHAGDLLEDMGYDRAAVLHNLRYIQTDNKFRSQYNYTNFGVTEAAVAAAKAANKTWEQLSQDRLYKPLGMDSTSSTLADFLTHTNRARGHVLIDGKWVAKYQREPDAQSPAGGASSNAHDMAQWLRLHLSGGKLDGKQIISAEALAETYRPEMPSNPASNPATDRTSFYGLGWGVGYDEMGRVKLSHSGAFALGAATTVSMLPSEQLGIVILTNSAPIGVPEALAASFMDLATYGKVQRDWVTLYKQGFAGMAAEGHSPTDYSKAPDHPAPARENRVYAGTYRNDFVGNVEIVSQGSRLVMQQGPRKLVCPLTHYDGDVFFYETTGENAVGLSGVTFSARADGKIGSVVIENLNAFGLGTLARVE